MSRLAETVETFFVPLWARGHRRSPLADRCLARNRVDAMALAAALCGGLWIGLVGGLRHYRGINETIASLLFNYLAIALLLHLVTGRLRDPESLNKPASPAIGDAN